MSSSTRPLTHVLRGELRPRNNPKEIAIAEQDFRVAIELSRKMRAKSLELRATSALARLLRNSGRLDEAPRDTYGNLRLVHRGFDTADLRDAKALLDELSV